MTYSRNGIVEAMKTLPREFLHIGLLCVGLIITGFLFGDWAWGVRIVLWLVITAGFCRIFTLMIEWRRELKEREKQ
jgi:Na+-driven multidrug efflux pump